MRKPCAGSLDKSPPKEVLWKTVPHRLFFGRDHSKTWGPGGVAFLHPESNSQDRAYMCLYRITYVIVVALFPFHFNLLLKCNSLLALSHKVSIIAIHISCKIICIF